MLDTLSTEYTQRAFDNSSRSFTVCVKGLGTVLYNYDNTME